MKIKLLAFFFLSNAISLFAIGKEKTNFPAPPAHTDLSAYTEACSISRPPLLDSSTSSCTLPLTIAYTPYYCAAIPGTATATASGTPPYTYLWSPGGQSTATISGLSAGVYSLFVSDSSGCTDSSGISISSATISYTISGNPITIVMGDSTLLTATCPVAATFSWAPAGSVTHPDSATTYANPTVTTEYTVTITTACGTYTDSILISVNCFAIGLSSLPACASSADGTASVAPSTGTPPYTYSWSPGGQTTASATGVSAGIYNVTVYDSTGCSSTGSVSVSSQSESFSISGNPLSILTGDSTYLYEYSSLPATYSWAPAASVTNPTSEGSYAHPAVTTEYTVTITTACGTFIDSVLISVNCFNIGLSSSPSYCTSGTATAVPLGGLLPYTYSWTPGGQTTATATGLSAGSYMVTILDNTGCSATGTISVSSASVSYAIAGNPNPISVGDSTYLDATCSIPSTYSWAPPLNVTNPDSAGTFASPTATTEYTVTITNSCGTYVDSILINIQCFSLHVTATAAAQCASSSFDGTATVSASGGTPPYTYLWSPGGQTTATITGLSTGVYSVTVYDSTGCISTGLTSVFFVTQSFTISGNPTTILLGDSTLLSATSNTPATYSWAPATGVTNPNSASTYASPAVTTLYTVTITTGCGSYTETILITVDCFPISISSTPSCSNANTGTASVTASGGVLPYTYLWAPGGQNTPTVTGLSGGTYTVTVYDATGCSSSAIDSVASQTESYTISGNPSFITIGDSTLLSATSNLPATYSWAPPLSVTNPNSASTYATPAVTTNYSVTITTPCGTFVDNVLIYVNCFNINLTSSDAYCSSADGFAMVNPSGGTAPYTYSWVPGGQTVSSLTGLTAGTFTIIVNDATGCGATATASITQVVGPPPVTASATPHAIIAGDSSYLSANIGVYSTFIWSPTTGLTNPTSQNTYAHPAVTTVYTVSALTLCGTVTAYDTVVVYACADAYNEPICIVTVDTATGRCEVVWGRTNSPPAGGSGNYTIYKDSTLGYTPTHTQPLNVLSEFIDPFSTPSAGPVSYKLSTVDSCGESTLSAAHTSIYLTATTGTTGYILNWTAYIGFTPTLYRIFRGATVSTLVQIDSVSSSILTYLDTLAPTGSLYMVEGVNPAGTCVPLTHGHISPSSEFPSGSLSNIFNSAILGIQPINGSITAISIYPNPSNGQFTIQWSVPVRMTGSDGVNSKSSAVQISVLDELGQVVYAENKNTHIGLNTEQLNLENLASGIYTLRMQTNGGITMKKLVVMKK